MEPHHPSIEPSLALIQCTSSLSQHGTELEPFVMGSDEENSPPPQVIHRSHPCQGVTIEFPEGKNVYLEWPWKEQAELAMAWDIQIKASVLTLHALSCLQSTPEADEPCRECNTLQHNQRLSHIQDRIHRGIPKTTPYKYFGMSRLIEMMRQKDNQINNLKL